MSFEAFAKGFAKSLNQNFQQKRKQEAAWKQTKMENFVSNTLPQYRKEKRQASEIRARAQDGVRFLQNRKGMSQEEAANVAWAYADKYDNMVDYRKALAKDIAGADQQQTEAAMAQGQQAAPDSDPISAYAGAENTEANRQAMRYDMAETGSQWRSAIQDRQQSQSMSVPEQQASGEASGYSQSDGPGFIRDNVLGQTNYAEASEEAYQRLSQMTGLSTGMIKLIEMGQANQGTPSGSLAGVEMNRDSDNLDTLETSVQSNWNELPEQARDAYNTYLDTGDTAKLQEAASMIPVSDSDSGMSPVERMEANVVDNWNALSEEARDAYRSYTESGNVEDLRTAASEIPQGLSLEDMISRRFVENFQSQGSGGSSGTLSETMQDSGGASETSEDSGGDTEPKDKIPLSALDQGDIEEIATNLHAKMQRESPNDLNAWMRKQLKSEGYTKDAAREILEVFNNNYASTQ